ncbi:MAG: hypothetical protein K8E66_03025 [Phycisphaerales bacterium]|nr:hypothetical protein [Phycisphaerales bacterium]
MRKQYEPHSAPRPFSVGAAIGDGWETFLNRYPLLLGSSALYLVIVIAASLFASITSLFTILPFVDWAAQFFFYPFMALGLLYIGLRCARGQHADIAMLFAGFRRYWPIVGISAIIFVITLAMLIPAMLLGFGFGALLAFSGSAPAGVTVAALVLVMLVGLVAPMLYVLPRVTYAAIVCFDPEGVSPGVMRSLSIAWRMTGRPGVHLRLIALWLLSIPLFLVCALLLLLPLLFLAIPLSVSVVATAYRQIAHQHWDALRRHCRVCEYDLSDTRTGVCPECGNPIPDDQLEELA